MTKGESRKRPWITYESKAYLALKEILTKTRFLNNISKSALSIHTGNIYTNIVIFVIIFYNLFMYVSNVVVALNVN